MLTETILLVDKQIIYIAPGDYSLLLLFTNTYCYKRLFSASIVDQPIVIGDYSLYRLWFTTLTVVSSSQETILWFDHLLIYRVATGDYSLCYCRQIAIGTWDYSLYRLFVSTLIVVLSSQETILWFDHLIIYNIVTGDYSLLFLLINRYCYRRLFSGSIVD